MIEDLENRNRKLVERINDMMLSRATEYKENIINALTKNNSPEKQKRVFDERLGKILEEEKNVTNMKQSPPHSHTKQHELRYSARSGSYFVKRDLERMDEPLNSGKRDLNQAFN